MEASLREGIPVVGHVNRQMGAFWDEREKVKRATAENSKNAEKVKVVKAEVVKLRIVVIDRRPHFVNEFSAHRVKARVLADEMALTAYFFARDLVTSARTKGASL